jgi:hypothetical protein
LIVADLDSDIDAHGFDLRHSPVLVKPIDLFSGINTNPGHFEFCNNCTNTKKKCSNSDKMQIIRLYWHTFGTSGNNEKLSSSSLGVAHAIILH